MGKISNQKVRNNKFLNPLFKILLIFILCMSALTCIPTGQKRALNPIIDGCVMQLLGIELKTSGSAASTLNY